MLMLYIFVFTLDATLRNSHKIGEIGLMTVIEIVKEVLFLKVPKRCFSNYNNLISTKCFLTQKSTST